jgi:hypothetical protein
MPFSRFGKIGFFPYMPSTCWIPSHPNLPPLDSLSAVAQNAFTEL